MSLLALLRHAHLMVLSLLRHAGLVPLVQQRRRLVAHPFVCHGCLILLMLAVAHHQIVAVSLCLCMLILGEARGLLMHRLGVLLLLHLGIGLETSRLLMQ